MKMTLTSDVSTPTDALTSAAERPIRADPAPAEARSAASAAKAARERQVRNKPGRHDDNKDDVETRVKDGVHDASVRFDDAMARYASQQVMHIASTQPDPRRIDVDAMEQRVMQRTAGPAALPADIAGRARVGTVPQAEAARYTLFPNAPGTARSIAIDVAVGTHSAALTFRNVGGVLARQLSARRATLTGALSGALGKPVEITLDVSESQEAIPCLIATSAPGLLAKGKADDHG